VLVRKKRADLVLALETLERDFVLGHLVVEDLQRDAGLVLPIDTLVDSAHAAVGHFATDLIATA